MIGLGRVGHDWVMHGSNYDVINVSTCSIITTEPSMCSLVMNLKAEYLPGIPHRTKMWDELGSRGIFGCRSGGSHP